MDGARSAPAMLPMRRRQVRLPGWGWEKKTEKSDPTRGAAPHDSLSAAAGAGDRASAIFGCAPAAASAPAAAAAATAATSATSATRAASDGCVLEWTRADAARARPGRDPWGIPALLAMLVATSRTAN